MKLFLCKILIHIQIVNSSKQKESAIVCHIFSTVLFALNHGLELEKRAGISNLLDRWLVFSMLAGGSTCK